MSAGKRTQGGGMTIKCIAPRKTKRERRMRTVLRECEQLLVEEIYTFQRPADGKSARLLGRIRRALKP